MWVRSHHGHELIVTQTHVILIFPLDVVPKRDDGFRVRGRQKLEKRMMSARFHTVDKCFETDEQNIAVYQNDIDFVSV